MRLIICLASLLGFAAQAKQVQVTCATKSYSCATGSCAWVVTSAPSTMTLNMTRDPDYPKEQAPYEVWRATYLANHDGHFLTLLIRVADSGAGTSLPVTVFATLRAEKVFAESRSTNQADIGLRNQTYGRGYRCSPIRVIE